MHIIITIKKYTYKYPKYFTMILIKLYNFVFLVYMKMDQENTMFFENQDESYTMIDVYLYDRFFGHKIFFI